MHWIEDYQLFLLDFDGLLVNTEQLHYAAYQEMCKEEGVEMLWDFLTYCTYAHKNATAVKDQLYIEFPQLNPDWGALYERKRQLYSRLIQERGAELMPGVSDFLYALQDAGAKRCVVTHSADLHVVPIKESSDALMTIPHWIMRDDYTKPKPDPESYLLAVERYADEGDRIIGFEDTPRGLQALTGANVQPVWVSAISYGKEVHEKWSKVPHFESFEKMPQTLIGRIK